MIHDVSRAPHRHYYNPNYSPARHPRRLPDLVRQGETIPVQNGALSQEQREGTAGLLRLFQYCQGCRPTVEENRAHSPVLEVLFQDAAVRGTVIHDQQAQILKPVVLCDDWPPGPAPNLSARDSQQGIEKK